ncbi:hypothetical protein KIMH_11040 [Bombiscardovia apis]|uniref:Uncharacterized protein n=1 Tax=Bombiscardovia apis TaxID=2932182 RepID=A0ABM8BDN3_9BIFI|nr:hypothetical protein KIMH_11040 [Bombiscardovia apis]
MQGPASCFTRSQLSPQFSYDSRSGRQNSKSHRQQKSTDPKKRTTKSYSLRGDDESTASNR